MRKLMVLLLLLVLGAIGWGAFWFVGATATEKAWANWLAERRSESWVAKARSIETRGFPNRFDTSFDGVELADPETQMAWSAPLFQLLSLSYKPTHLIAVWPDEQTFSTPQASHTLAAARMRGSLKVAPSAAVMLETATIEAAEATLTSTKGWTARLASGQVSMRQRPGAEDPALYDIFITMTDLDPGDAFLAPLRGVADLPRVIGALTASAQVRFDRVWDRRAIEDARPQPREIVLEELSARWGNLALRGTGRLDVDATGQPAGEIALEATNWREMVAIAEATGAVSPDEADALIRGLTLIAGLSGDPDQLDVTLSFDNGLAFIGPVPVGPAPVVRLP